ncbi:MAG: nucleotidyltransferase [Euryarchaeota archaeon]|nr:nucleotidyltransferase [Euryarchaeota archaeon]
MRSIDEILKLICTFLNKEGVEYVVVGGLAVLFYGIPRTTMDIDLIIAMDMPKVKRFVEFLNENDFFADEEDIKAAFGERTHATVEDKTSMIRLDIKGIYGENDRITLERRRKVSLANFEIYIAALEDLIANKLLFGSEQDVKDVEGIYVRQFDNLDMAYLEERCERLGVYEEFSATKTRVERQIREEEKIRKSF